MRGVDAEETCIEVLCFKKFYGHFVFAEDKVGNWNKRLVFKV